MHYNQPMIDLVYAIRGRLSDSDKRAIKTTNPELLEDLAEIYSASSDVKLCGFIQELMTMAGKTWLDLLHLDPQTTMSAAAAGQILLYPRKQSLQRGENLTSNEAEVLTLAPITSRATQVAFA